MAELIPPPERELPPQTLAAIRHSVLAFAAPPRRRLPSRRIVLVLAIGFAVAAGATAYALVATTGEQLTNAVVCHNEPRLASSVTGILGADGRDPRVICAQGMWNRRAPAPRWMRRAAPPLVACGDAEHGEIDVFPSTDAGLCERLGLGPVPPDYRREAARYAAMIEDLDRSVRDRCLGDERARRVAREVLDRHGYDDWAVETPDYGPRRPCRDSLASHPERKAVILVAGPRHR